MLHAHFHASVHVALPQTFLSNLFLSSTWAASQAICYAHEAIYILKLGPFAFSTVSDHAHHLRVHWLGKFSFFMVFEIHSWPMVCGAVTTYFWLAPTYWTNPSINQAWDFSSSFGWLYRTSPPSSQHTQNHPVEWWESDTEVTMVTLGSRLHASAACLCLVVLLVLHPRWIL